ncbi:hypothetical protein OTU49_000694 [Cherax quadricarinatus]|uniref:Uncharacterized protein n=1 Tax=Cherax quadricarinatus TaxID=27406 RepID=A0AAW0XK64_CHEQU
MEKDFVSRTRLLNKDAFTHFARTPGTVSQTDTRLESLSNSFVRSASKEYTSEVQVLNLHPVREEVMTALARRGGRRGIGRGTVAPKSIDELYWMLPGAIPDS